jgi:hypothetical protein
VGGYAWDRKKFRGFAGTPGAGKKVKTQLAADQRRLTRIGEK